MAVSSVKAVFTCDVKTIWDIVTDLENYAWRSDLGKVEIISEKRFSEYAKNGFKTDFTVTIVEQYKRWEFDMENDNIKGHWTGIFTQAGEETEIEFTENVTAKKFFMKPLVKGYIKKQQGLYIDDLEKAVDSRR